MGKRRSGQEEEGKGREGRGGRGEMEVRKEGRGEKEVRKEGRGGRTRTVVYIVGSRHSHFRESLIVNVISHFLPFSPSLNS